MGIIPVVVGNLKSNIVPPIIGSCNSKILPESSMTSSIYSDGQINRSSDIIFQKINSSDGTDTLISNADIKNNRQMLIGAVVVVGLLIGLIAYQYSLKSFKNEFTGEWLGFFESSDGTSTPLLFDIDDDEIDYSMISSLGNLSLDQYDYEVVFPGRIKINGKTYGIKFSDDTLDGYVVMTVSPAITSTDATEKWYKEK